jgi:hypothetical protein
MGGNCWHAANAAAQCIHVLVVQILVFSVQFCSCLVMNMHIFTTAAAVAAAAHV